MPAELIDFSTHEPHIFLHHEIGALMNSHSFPRALKHIKQAREISLSDGRRWIDLITNPGGWNRSIRRDSSGGSSFTKRRIGSEVGGRVGSELGSLVGSVRGKQLGSVQIRGMHCFRISYPDRIGALPLLAARISCIGSSCC